jgi:2-polyprenyl-3-methyl-5-hydroxy-6-metoxy-1,4-benzoquinol methylase
MESATASHWDRVYETKARTEVSWFERSADTSLALIEQARPAPDAAIIDVGGGASPLAAQLVGAGYRDVTVADISAAALDQAREMAGEQADGITYLLTDVADSLDRTYALWHDRALFHFMVDPDRTGAYLETLAAAVEAGGHAVIATFGPEGPTECSGLPVVRYDAAALAELLPDFELESSRYEIHKTPGGKEQQFLYALLRRSG